VQLSAARSLWDQMSRFNDETPAWLDAGAVLADPRWHAIRKAAILFVEAFDKKWPDSH
jgi:hypothetical protein